MKQILELFLMFLTAVDLVESADLVNATAAEAD